MYDWQVSVGHNATTDNVVCISHMCHYTKRGFPFGFHNEFQHDIWRQQRITALQGVDYRNHCCWCPALAGCMSLRIYVPLPGISSRVSEILESVAGPGTSISFWAHIQKSFFYNFAHFCLNNCTVVPCMFFFYRKGHFLQYKIILGKKKHFLLHRKSLNKDKTTNPQTFKSRMPSNLLGKSAE